MEISSSESFHESDDEDARIRRRRRVKAAKISAAQKRGWRTKVGKRGGKRGRGGRPKTERGFGPPEGSRRGGKRGTTQKRASSSRTVKIEQVDGALGSLQQLFDREPLPARRAQKTRHSAMEKGKEVDRGAKSDVEMGDFLPPDTSASTMSPKRVGQNRYTNMGLGPRLKDEEEGGEGSSAAAVAEEHLAEEAPKRALKSYANMQKRRDVRSILKHRRYRG